MKRKISKLNKHHHHASRTWKLIILLGSLAGVLTLFTVLIIMYRDKAARGLIPSRLSYNMGDAPAVAAMQMSQVENPYDVLSMLVATHGYLADQMIENTSFVWTETSETPVVAYQADGYKVTGSESDMSAAEFDGFPHALFFSSRGFVSEVSDPGAANTGVTYAAWKKDSLICLVEKNGKLITTSCGSRDSFRAR